jgi:hypothetical protein
LLNNETIILPAASVSIECSKVGEQMFTMKSEVVARQSVVRDDIVESDEESL